MLFTILIVDDSGTDRAIIKNMLDGYSILTACDGIEAMRVLQENDSIDLMILDLNMPNMNGFQVLEAMRDDKRLKQIRTIILTNYDELENEIKGLKLGAVDYIRKPIHMDSLKARIEVHVSLLQIKQAMEQKLLEQGLTFEMIFNQVPVGIAISFSKNAVSASHNKHFSINPAFEKIAGRTKEELLVTGWAAITHPDDVEENLAYYDKLQAGEIDHYAMDKRIIKPDGTVVWVHLLVASLVLSDSNQFNHIALFQDISEKKLIEQKLVESERSKDALLSHLPGMAYRCGFDRDWTMLYVSEGCLGLTGYSPENLIGNKEIAFNELIAPEYREALWKEWVRVAAAQRSFNYEYQITTKSGRKKWVLEMGQAVYDQNDGVEALEGIIIDISDRKAIESTLQYNNDHERWTGLLNRDVLEGMLNKDLEAGSLGKCALVSINLSSLQTLTTMYGVHYMQDILKNVSHGLLSHCLEGQTLFNTYENRFVFYGKNFPDKSVLQEFVNTIKSALESILSIERVGGGIGVLEIDETSKSTVDEILMNLLIASEIAAVNNDSDFGICFYNAEIEARINREKEIEQALSRISAESGDSGLSLQYQPILDLATNQICGFEALARLYTQDLGQVSPLDFIPIAERTKLIIPMGTKIFRQAFRFLRRLEESGIDSIRVFVNVSVIQLLKKGFPENLLDLIREMNVSPMNFGIEITESVFSSNYQEINRILAKLKQKGIHISIDDFGTGYSSFARESELNVNCLKIDKFFVDKLMSPDPDLAITRDIISIAHRLNHSSVAEGVEHAEQLQLLKEYGCEKAQGFFISRPLDEEAAFRMIQQQENKASNYAADSRQQGLKSNE